VVSLRANRDSGVGFRATPDTIAIDTEPQWPPNLPPVRRNMMIQQWQSIQTGTTAHENRHRQICHEWVDRKVAFSNQSRVRGWALTERRARSLAQAEFQVTVMQELATMSEQYEDEQAQFDITTNHGLK
jgi:predicted secreted Zn-dependent protease